MKLKVTPFQPPDILESSGFAGFFFALSRMSPNFPNPSTFTKRCYVPMLCKTFNVHDYVNNFTSKKCTNVYQISYFVYLFLIQFYLFISILATIFPRYTFSWRKRILIYGYLFAGFAISPYTSLHTICCFFASMIVYVSFASMIC